MKNYIRTLTVITLSITLGIVLHAHWEDYNSISSQADRVVSQVISNF